MFTGIVRALGRIEALTPTDGDTRLTIDCGGLDVSGVTAGDSIAVNGTCLTALTIEGARFVADVSRETLALTTLGGAVEGTPVNLEPALAAGEPLGGHLVSGHVDGIATVTERAGDARSWRFRIAPPATLMRYIARKGSVTVDGVSLTVNDVTGRDFGVNIVPHTFENTVFSDYEVGSRVNIEVDLLARYIERLLEQRDADAN